MARSKSTGLSTGAVNKKAFPCRRLRLSFSCEKQHQQQVATGPRSDEIADIHVSEAGNAARNRVEAPTDPQRSQWQVGKLCCLSRCTPAQYANLLAEFLGRSGRSIGRALTAVLLMKWPSQPRPSGASFLPVAPEQGAAKPTQPVDVVTNF